MVIINRFFPEGVLVVFGLQREPKSVVQQVVVADGQFDFPPWCWRSAQLPETGNMGLRREGLLFFRLVGFATVFGQVHGR